MASKKTKETPSPKAGKGTPSTQQYLDVAEVRDGVLVMKDGTMRAVVLVSSMNFALKSEDEQNAIIQSYVQFLNSLDFPFQIVIQSRKLDVSKYLNELARREKQQTNDLLKLQMSDYRQFVSELVELGDIMSKKFFVVVPYNPSGDKKRGFFAQLSSLFSSPGAIRLREEQFLEMKHELDQRVGVILSGLSSMGLNAVELDTQSIIELLYTLYNPDTAEQERMVDVSQLRVD